MSYESQDAASSSNNISNKAQVEQQQSQDHTSSSTSQASMQSQQIKRHITGMPPKCIRQYDIDAIDPKGDLFKLVPAMINGQPHSLVFRVKDTRELFDESHTDIMKTASKFDLVKNRNQVWLWYYKDEFMTNWPNFYYDNVRTQELAQKLMAFLSLEDNGIHQLCFKLLKNSVVSGAVELAFINDDIVNRSNYHLNDSEIAVAAQTVNDNDRLSILIQTAHSESILRCLANELAYLLPLGNVNHKLTKDKIEQIEQFLVALEVDCTPIVLDEKSCDKKSLQRIGSKLSDDKLSALGRLLVIAKQFANELEEFLIDRENYSIKKGKTAIFICRLIDGAQRSVYHRPKLFVENLASDLSEVLTKTEVDTINKLKSSVKNNEKKPEQKPISPESNEAIIDSTNKVEVGYELLAMRSIDSAMSWHNTEQPAVEQPADILIVPYPKFSMCSSIYTIPGNMHLPFDATAPIHQVRIEHLYACFEYEDGTWEVFYKDVAREMLQSYGLTQDMLTKMFDEVHVFKDTFFSEHSYSSLGTSFRKLVNACPTISITGVPEKCGLKDFIAIAKQSINTSFVCTSSRSGATLSKETVINFLETKITDFDVSVQNGIAKVGLIHHLDLCNIFETEKMCKRLYHTPESSPKNIDLCSSSSNQQTLSKPLRKRVSLPKKSKKISRSHFKTHYGSAKGGSNLTCLKEKVAIGKSDAHPEIYQNYNHGPLEEKSICKVKVHASKSSEKQLSSTLKELSDGKDLVSQRIVSILQQATSDGAITLNVVDKRAVNIEKATMQPSARVEHAKIRFYYDKSDKHDITVSAHTSSKITKNLVHELAHLTILGNQNLYLDQQKMKLVKKFCEVLAELKKVLDSKNILTDAELDIINELFDDQRDLDITEQFIDDRYTQDERSLAARLLIVAERFASSAGLLIEHKTTLQKLSPELCKLVETSFEELDVYYKNLAKDSKCVRKQGRIQDISRSFHQQTMSGNKEMVAGNVSNQQWLNELEDHVELPNTGKDYNQRRHSVHTQEFASSTENPQSNMRLSKLIDQSMISIQQGGQDYWVSIKDVNGETVHHKVKDEDFKQQVMIAFKLHEKSQSPSTNQSKGKSTTQLNKPVKISSSSTTKPEQEKIAWDKKRAEAWQAIKRSMEKLTEEEHVFVSSSSKSAQQTTSATQNTQQPTNNSPSSDKTLSVENPSLSSSSQEPPASQTPKNRLDNTSNIQANNLSAGKSNSTHSSNLPVPYTRPNELPEVTIPALKIPGDSFRIGFNGNTQGPQSYSSIKPGTITIEDPSKMYLPQRIPRYKQFNYRQLGKFAGPAANIMFITLAYKSKLNYEREHHADNSELAHKVVAATGVALDRLTIAQLSRFMHFTSAATMAYTLLELSASAAHVIRDIPPAKLAENRAMFQTYVYGQDFSPQFECQLLAAYDRKEPWAIEFATNAMQTYKQVLTPARWYHDAKNGLFNMIRAIDKVGDAIGTCLRNELIHCFTSWGMINVNHLPGEATRELMHNLRGIFSFGKNKAAQSDIPAAGMPSVLRDPASVFLDRPLTPCMFAVYRHYFEQSMFNSATPLQDAANLTGMGGFNYGYFLHYNPFNYGMNLNLFPGSDTHSLAIPQASNSQLDSTVPNQNKRRNVVSASSFGDGNLSDKEKRELLQSNAVRSPNSNYGFTSFHIGSGGISLANTVPIMSDALASASLLYITAAAGVTAVFAIVGYIRHKVIKHWQAKLKEHQKHSRKDMEAATSKMISLFNGDDLASFKLDVAKGNCEFYKQKIATLVSRRNEEILKELGYSSNKRKKLKDISDQEIKALIHQGSSSKKSSSEKIWNRYDRMISELNNYLNTTQTTIDYKIFYDKSQTLEGTHSLDNTSSIELDKHNNAEAKSTASIQRCLLSLTMDENLKRIVGKGLDEKTIAFVSLSLSKGDLKDTKESDQTKISLNQINSLCKAIHGKPVDAIDMSKVQKLLKILNHKDGLYASFSRRGLSVAALAAVKLFISNINIIDKDVKFAHAVKDNYAQDGFILLCRSLTEAKTERQRQVALKYIKLSVIKAYKEHDTLSMTSKLRTLEGLYGEDPAVVLFCQIVQDTLTSCQNESHDLLSLMKPQFIPNEAMISVGNTETKVNGFGIDENILKEHESQATKQLSKNPDSTVRQVIASSASANIAITQGNAEPAIAILNNYKDLPLDMRMDLLRQFILIALVSGKQQPLDKLMVIWQKNMLNENENIDAMQLPDGYTIACGYQNALNKKLLGGVAKKSDHTEQTQLYQWLIQHLGEDSLKIRSKVFPLEQQVLLKQQQIQLMAFNTASKLYFTQLMAKVDPTILLSPFAEVANRLHLDSGVKRARGSRTIVSDGAPSEKGDVNYANQHVESSLLIVGKTPREVILMFEKQGTSLVEAYEGFSNNHISSVYTSWKKTKKNDPKESIEHREKLQQWDTENSNGCSQLQGTLKLIWTSVDSDDYETLVEIAKGLSGIGIRFRAAVAEELVEGFQRFFINAFRSADNFTAIQQIYHEKFKYYAKEICANQTILKAGKAKAFITLVSSNMARAILYGEQRINQDSHEQLDEEVLSDFLNINVSSISPAVVMTGFQANQYRLHLQEGVKIKRGQHTQLGEGSPHDKGDVNFINRHVEGAFLVVGKTAGEMIRAAQQQGKSLTQLVTEFCNNHVASVQKTWKNENEHGTHQNTLAIWKSNLISDVTITENFIITIWNAKNNLDYKSLLELGQQLAQVPAAFRAQVVDEYVVGMSVFLVNSLQDADTYEKQQAIYNNQYTNFCELINQSPIQGFKEKSNPIINSIDSIFNDAKNIAPNLNKPHNQNGNEKLTLGPDYFDNIIEKLLISGNVSLAKTYLDKSSDKQRELFSNIIQCIENNDYTLKTLMPMLETKSDTFKTILFRDFIAAIIGSDRARQFECLHALEVMVEPVEYQRIEYMHRVFINLHEHLNSAIYLDDTPLFFDKAYQLNSTVLKSYMLSQYDMARALPSSRKRTIFLYQLYNQSEPDNEATNIQLINLYVLSKQFAAARSFIESEQSRLEKMNATSDDADNTYSDDLTKMLLDNNVKEKLYQIELASHHYELDEHLEKLDEIQTDDSELTRHIKYQRYLAFKKYDKPEKAEETLASLASEHPNQYFAEYIAYLIANKKFDLATSNVQKLMQECEFGGEEFSKHKKTIKQINDFEKFTVIKDILDAGTRLDALQSFYTDDEQLKGLIRQEKLDTLMKRGKFQEAKALADQMLDEQPHNVMFKAKQAMIQSESGDIYQPLTTMREINLTIKKSQLVIVEKFDLFEAKNYPANAIVLSNDGVVHFVEDGRVVANDDLSPVSAYLGNRRDIPFANGHEPVIYGADSADAEEVKSNAIAIRSNTSINSVLTLPAQQQQVANKKVMYETEITQAAFDALLNTIGRLAIEYDSNSKVLKGCKTLFTVAKEIHHLWPSLGPLLVQIGLELHQNGGMLPDDVKQSMRNMLIRSLIGLKGCADFSWDKMMNPKFWGKYFYNNTQEVIHFMSYWHRLLSNPYINRLIGRWLGENAQNLSQWFVSKGDTLQHLSTAGNVMNLAYNYLYIGLYKGEAIKGAAHASVINVAAMGFNKYYEQVWHQGEMESDNYRFMEFVKIVAATGAVIVNPGIAPALIFFGTTGSVVIKEHQGASREATYGNRLKRYYEYLKKGDVKAARRELKKLEKYFDAFHGGLYSPLKKGDSPTVKQIKIICFNIKVKNLLTHHLINKLPTDKQLKQEGNDYLVFSKKDSVHVKKISAPKELNDDIEPDMLDTIDTVYIKRQSYMSLLKARARYDMQQYLKLTAIEKDSSNNWRIKDYHIPIIHVQEIMLTRLSLLMNQDFNQFEQEFEVIYSAITKHLKQIKYDHITHYRESIRQFEDIMLQLAKEAQNNQVSSVYIGHLLGNKPSQSKAQEHKKQLAQKLHRISNFKPLHQLKLKCLITANNLYRMAELYYDLENYEKSMYYLLLCPKHELTDQHRCLMARIYYVYCQDKQQAMALYNAVDRKILQNCDKRFYAVLLMDSQSWLKALEIIEALNYQSRTYGDWMLMYEITSGLLLKAPSHAIITLRYLQVIMLNHCLELLDKKSGRKIKKLQSAINQIEKQLATTVGHYKSIQQIVSEHGCASLLNFLLNNKGGYTIDNNRGPQKVYELEMEGDGSCLFHSIGVSRKSAAAALLKNRQEYYLRALAAPEICVMFKTGTLPQEMMSDQTTKSLHEDFVATNNVLYQKTRAITDKLQVNGINHEVIERLLEKQDLGAIAKDFPMLKVITLQRAKNALSKLNVKPFKDALKVVAKIDKMIFRHCTKEDVFVAYIKHVLLDDTMFMGYDAKPNTNLLDAIAKLYKLNITIWKKNVTNNNIGLDYTTQHVKDGQSLMLFFTTFGDNKKLAPNHFNRFITRADLCIVPQGPSPKVSMTVEKLLSLPQLQVNEEASAKLTQMQHSSAVLRVKHSVQLPSAHSSHESSSSCQNLTADERIKLGLVYLTGDGVKVSLSKGLTLINEAKKTNSLLAHQCLIMIYEQGIGVAKNLNVALEHCNDGIKNNHECLKQERTRIQDLISSNKITQKQESSKRQQSLPSSSQANKSQAASQLPQASKMVVPAYQKQFLTAAKGFLNGPYQSDSNPRSDLEKIMKYMGNGKVAVVYRRYLSIMKTYPSQQANLKNTAAVWLLKQLLFTNKKQLTAKNIAVALKRLNPMAVIDADNLLCHFVEQSKASALPSKTVRFFYGVAALVYGLVDDKNKHAIFQLAQDSYKLPIPMELLCFSKINISKEVSQEQALKDFSTRWHEVKLNELPLKDKLVVLNKLTNVTNLSLKQAIDIINQFTKENKAPRKSALSK